MAWPGWIEELRARFLADEASAFLVHGAITGDVWDVDGEHVDALAALVRFLRPTRPVIGILRPHPPPSRLEFADFSDRSRFETLVRAYEAVERRTDHLDEQDAEHALGRIWRALSTAGTDQAYIVTGTERIAPGHRKRVEPIPGAPDLFSWPRHAMLRKSNNVLVFLAADPAAVRTELREAATLIEARLPDPEPEPDTVPDEEPASSTPPSE
jgi:hypothetical protein